MKYKAFHDVFPQYFGRLDEDGSVSLLEDKRKERDEAKKKKKKDKDK